MSLDLFLLIIVVITALAFDFTNGFHDTGNAMATSIASGALAPKTAVILSAVLNLVGAFLSTAVAATIAKGLIDANLVTLELVFAGLVGGIVWNLLTWLLGIPSSSSHALIGGIVGATIAAVGGHGVIWSGVVSKVLVPAVVAALLATFVAAAGTWLVYRVIRGLPGKRTESGFRHGQIGSASLVSLAHGTNDAQKTMGVIFLALMSYGAVSKTATMPPLWVIVSCAVAMAGGTYLGGWRIIRTLGKGLVEIKPPQGMAAESSSAAVILLSAHFGYALSTTQVATGSVLGSGVGKPGAEVRWGWPAGWWPHGSSRFHWPAWSGDHVRAGARHWRISRRLRRFRPGVPGRGRHLAAVTKSTSGPHERQRRLGRQPDGWTRRGREARRTAAFSTGTPTGAGTGTGTGNQW
ncbi:phosphate transporter family protein [Mycobacterium kansasii]|uniref:Phosphate transporter n=1 Tax=Mycobacterium kansasii TaxID=1768 RepID=A0A1V3WF22_MYCKA|nr:phosphate transporter family protein [Mycobacterium kansasii]